MDIFELTTAYNEKFGENVPLAGFNISTAKLATLYRDALKTGKKITERTLQEATNVAKPPTGVET